VPAKRLRDRSVEMDSPMYYDVFQYDAYNDQYNFVGTEYGRNGKEASQLVALRHFVMGSLYYRPSCSNKAPIPGDKGRDVLNA
jgi:hypothetical protein